MQHRSHAQDTMRTKYNETKCYVQKNNKVSGWKIFPNSSFGIGSDQDCTGLPHHSVEQTKPGIPWQIQ